MAARIPWTLALLSTLGVGGYLGLALFGDGRDKQVFLPGTATSGHHQIEPACGACHDPFRGVPQKACLACHGEALKEAEDSHANRKFADPRNAGQLAIMDVTRCTACHREHRPELIHAMDVTLPGDFCFECHRDVIRERPSHQDFTASVCADAGCHNYHDNKALYEDFLSAHLHEPGIRREARLPARNLGERLRGPGISGPPLAEADSDPPAGTRVAPDLLKEWAGTVHARRGVNCSGCHEARDAGQKPKPWKAHLDHAACRECHQDEIRGFLAGKHGMRPALKLSPMTPGLARLPMRTDAHDKTQGCTACHDDHAFDTRRAAVDACLGCHDDSHSRAYRQSPHFRLWQAELEGRGESGSGVSCATCHLPRTTRKRQGLVEVRVEHDQSLNLRPNEKMLRGVCMNCHGLGYAIDALADPRLIRENFSGKPGRHVTSLDLAEARQRSKQKANPLPADGAGSGPDPHPP